jgi:uncharacterized SAM-binding protein YcdF (DUF218 family)
MILMLLGLGFLFSGVKWHAWARRCFGLWLILFFIYGTPFLADHFTDTLENAYPVMTEQRLAELDLDEDAPVYIIVLGAGHSPDPRLGFTQMLSESVSMRLIEGVRLYNALPEGRARLVTSASAVHGRLSQAEALKGAAMQLGVPEAHIHTQSTPTNTCEEARAFAAYHGEGAQVIIATAALHQRRAMMLFEQQGVQPFAAPTAFTNKENPDAPPPGFSSYLPRLKNVNQLERVIKEYVGYEWGKRQCG